MEANAAALTARKCSLRVVFMARPVYGGNSRQLSGIRHGCLAADAVLELRFAPAEVKCFVFNMRLVLNSRSRVWHAPCKFLLHEETISEPVHDCHSRIWKCNDDPAGWQDYPNASVRTRPLVGGPVALRNHRPPVACTLPGNALRAAGEHEA